MSDYLKEIYEAKQQQNKQDSAEKQAKQRKLQNAYRAVFGSESNMSPHQQLVWHDLCRQCHMDKTTMTINPQTGQIDTHKTLSKEANRALLLYIQSQTQVKKEETL